MEEADDITSEGDSESHNCYSKIVGAAVASEDSQADLGRRQSGIHLTTVPVEGSAYSAFSCEVARFGRSKSDPCGTIICVWGRPWLENSTMATDHRSRSAAGPSLARL